MKKKLTPAQKLKKLAAKAEREKWEAELELQLKAAKLFGYTKQYKFHETRDWLVDFAYVSAGIAIEVDGGIWMSKGGHNTGKAILNDRSKDQALLQADWRVYRVVPEMIKSGEALKTIEHMLIRANEEASLNLRLAHLAGQLEITFNLEDDYYLDDDDTSEQLSKAIYWAIDWAEKQETTVTRRTDEGYIFPADAGKPETWRGK